MMRVGVIGLGDISQIHIPIISGLKTVSLVAVCDLDSGKSEAFQGIHFYTDYMEMLENEDLDSVHICLPHYLHARVALECLEQGVNVFLEKPVGLNLEEVEQMVQAEEKYSDLKINLCLQNRCNNTSVMMKAIVESGAYGRIIGMKGIVAWHRDQAYYGEKPWRGSMDLAGGGVMINQSIHTLDLMQWIGGKIKSVRGNAVQLLDYGIEVEDTVSAQFEFEDGFSGMFYATNANPYNANVELEVLMEKGKLRIQDNILYHVDEAGQRALIEDEKLHGLKAYYGASHRKLIQNFYSAIESNTAIYIKAREGVISMQMIDAIMRSSQEQQKIMIEAYHGR